MDKYLIVMLGSALGGSLRYWLSNVVYKFLPVTFPYGTLVVNFTGSFILALVIFYFDEKFLISPLLKLFLTIGICGGFTTFSTFSLETFNLFKEAEYFYAIANIFLSVIICLAAVYFGYVVSRIGS